MNSIEPSKNEVPVDSKPIFGSTWVSLFSTLRKNYTERHLIDTAEAENSKPTDWQQPDKKHS
jgi:hypothetical protein